MMSDVWLQELGMTVDIGIDRLVAQDILAQFLIARFHSLAESGVLQQPLP